MAGFFSIFAGQSRREHCELSLWWSAHHCASQFDRIAQPDGLEVSEPVGHRSLLPEHDRSTETVKRLGRRL